MPTPSPTRQASQRKSFLLSSVFPHTSSHLRTHRTSVPPVPPAAPHLHPRHSPPSPQSHAIPRGLSLTSFSKRCNCNHPMTTLDIARSELHAKLLRVVAVVTREPVTAHVGLMTYWALSPARGPMRCVWAVAGPGRVTRRRAAAHVPRGLRAPQRVNAHVQRFACEQHTTTDTIAPKTQTTSPTTAHFRRFLPRGLHFGHHTNQNHARTATKRGELHYMRLRHAGNKPSESFM